MTNPARTPIASVQAPVEVMGKLLAIMSTACIGLSVIYDWGFLIGAGLSFAEVPTTLSDHLRSAVIWLPLALIISVPTMAWLRWDTEQSAERRRRALANGLRAEDYDQRDLRRSSLVLGVLSLLGLTGWIVFGDMLVPGLISGAMLSLLLLAAYATKITPQNRKWMKWLQLTMLVAIVLGTFLFTFGFYESRRAIDPARPLAQLTVRTSSSNEMIRGTVVRSLEKAVIVINERREIMVIKPDELLRVQLTGPVKRNPGLRCMFREQSCK